MAFSDVSETASLYSIPSKMDPSDVVRSFSSGNVDQSSVPSPYSHTSLSGMTAVSSHLSLASPKFTCSEVDDKIAEYQFVQKYDTKKLHARMKEVALKAGEMMLSANITTIDTKNNTSDLVTETDKAIESMIKTELLTSFPSFEFFGEETSKQNQKLTDDATFVVDPIDGTLNFTHSLPNFAVSIAITYLRLPVAGVIYKPSTDEMWSALSGAGSFKSHPLRDAERDAHALELQQLASELHFLKTGEAIPVEFAPLDRSTRLPLRAPAPLGALNTALLALEWGNERAGPRWDARLALHASLLTTSPTGSMIQSIRSLGSAALDFCYVAEGRLDAYFEPGCRVWDIAAGWVILKQAGGRVFGVNPGDWEPTVEGRCYFAIRGAEERSQRAFAEEVWGRLGEGRFVYGEEQQQGVKVKGEEIEDGADGLEMKGLKGWAKQDRGLQVEGVAKSPLAVVA